MNNFSYFDISYYVVFNNLGDVVLRYSTCWTLLSVHQKSFVFCRNVKWKLLTTIHIYTMPTAETAQLCSTEWNFHGVDVITEFSYVVIFGPQIVTWVVSLFLWFKRFSKKAKQLWCYCDLLLLFFFFSLCLITHDGIIWLNKTDQLCVVVFCNFF